MESKVYKISPIIKKMETIPEKYACNIQTLSCISGTKKVYNVTSKKLSSHPKPQKTVF